MKQWLSTPATNGSIVRMLLICVCVFLIFVAAIDVAFNIGGPHWTAVSAAILTVVGLIAGLGQWLAPFPLPISPISNMITSEHPYEELYKREASYLKTGSNQETGTLIISTSKENQTVTFYLLPRKEFIDCRSSATLLDNNIHKKNATVTGEISGPHLLFIARFRNLKPGRYDIWIGWHVHKPKNFTIQIEKSVVSIFEMI